MAKRKNTRKHIGKNKKAMKLEARQRGYAEIISKMGYSGSSQTSSLPKRWGGFNKPGVSK